PAHDLSLQLGRRAVEGAVPCAQRAGEALLARANRLPGRRGQRPDVGLVRLLRARLLSGDAGRRRVRDRQPAVRPGRSDHAQWQGADDRRGKQQRRERLHPVGDVQRSAARGDLARPGGAAAGRHAHFRDGAQTQQAMGRRQGCRALLDERARRSVTAAYRKSVGETVMNLSRRDMLSSAGALAVAATLPRAAMAAQRGVSQRPPKAKRRFTSKAVEAEIARVKAKIGDPELAWLFENCYPNTLDTTVFPGEVGGKPDTFVITGDI